MKRAKLKDRVRLLSEARGDLLVAAKAAVTDIDSGIGYRIRGGMCNLELAALEFGKVSIRYLGGKQE